MAMAVMMVVMMMVMTTISICVEGQSNSSFHMWSFMILQIILWSFMILQI